MKDTRYVVTLEMYMFDKSDSAIKLQAKKLADKLSKQDDNQCTVQEIVAQEFGKLGNRKVKI